jgi:Protein ENHANCED DISEASE RESISTANCE 2, C-terminal
MILYFEIPPHLTRYMTTQEVMIEDKLSPAEKTAALWLIGDREYKNNRLKLIAYVAEGPWVVRNIVTGRPALIGKRLPVTYDLHPSSSKKNEAPLLIATLDIGNSSAAAKKIVSVCRRYMSSLTVDIGFVIQGETAQELPEQMLGSVRVHGPDPLRAPKLNPK